MAMETASASPAPPSAQVVGIAFVEQYYHILHHSPELVYRFYNDASVLSRPDPNGLMMNVKTMKSIDEYILSLDSKNYKAEIKTADSQGSYKDGVIVLVTGCLTKNSLSKKFTQTFFLAPQDNGYYVLNDVFRYVEETEPEVANGVVGVDDKPSSSLTQDTEPVRVIEPPDVNHETLLMEEVEAIEEKSSDQVTDERQPSNDKNIVVEPQSQSNENHVSIVVESVISESLQDAPKKSYASIVSSQTRKPTKIYVPTNSSKVASAKTVKPPVNPGGEASSSEAPVAPITVSENKNVQQDVEGHSIYIRNLPLNITVAQLETEFNKFGPIKQNGVQVRSNRQQGFCFGFVEFQEFGSMQSAIKASPITIGDHKVVVEMKRKTTRVGSGKSRFTSPRGNFRNDSFRGRGNFGSGGQTYVRSDSFRGGGNFSGGFGGEQGRGMGGRRSGPSQNLATE